MKEISIQKHFQLIFFVDVGQELLKIGKQTVRNVLYAQMFFSSCTCGKEPQTKMLLVYVGSVKDPT